MLRGAAGRLWLPFTQMSRFDGTSPRFVRGSGNYLFDSCGNRVFDAVSSIWTTLHGHSHPLITEAIARQAAALDHATLLGASHPLAEDLASRLAALSGLDYVFFSSDGASAIEAAIKMALQFWQNCGEPERTRFVRLTGAYHGDTAGAMSVSGIALFKSRFAPITFETAEYTADRTTFERGDVAAVIVEPVVQAAAGMRIVPIRHYDALGNIAPLVIVDEIATGFGRTGSMFAIEKTAIRPDLMCVGKGLTGGGLALSATIVTERVFDAFLADDTSSHFFHGHSYAGNPIACAAALANLSIFDREGTLDRVRRLVRSIEPALSSLARNPRVRDVRRCGLMIGIEIDCRGLDGGPAGSPARRIARDLYERGHFTRPIGDVIQLVPPLSSTDAELHAFVNDCHDVLG